MRKGAATARAELKTRCQTEVVVALHDAKSGSTSGPSEPSVYVDRMAASLVGAALVMVLVAANEAA